MSQFCGLAVQLSSGARVMRATDPTFGQDTQHEDGRRNFGGGRRSHVFDDLVPMNGPVRVSSKRQRISQLSLRAARGGGAAIPFPRLYEVSERRRTIGQNVSQ